MSIDTATKDFFCLRLDHMIDLRHSLAVLSSRMLWQQIEASLAHRFSAKVRQGKKLPGIDLFGRHHRATQGHRTPHGLGLAQNSTAARARERAKATDCLRGPGLPRCGGRQPGHSHQAPGQIQEANRAVTQVAQAVPGHIIGHLKADHRMNRCYLKGEQGDRLNAVLCAAGYNIKWLLRMIAKKAVAFLQPLYLRLCEVASVMLDWVQVLRELTRTILVRPCGGLVVEN